MKNILVIVLSFISCTFTNALPDENGPELDLFLNDENFVSGGISNSTPLLIVSVFDENGINTVGNGIGHDIELVIDNDLSNSVILNNYYVKRINFLENIENWYDWETS